MKPIIFKVRYGFDKMATLSVEAGPELEKAIYAWAEQIPVTIGNKMIQGKHIISIEPDYHYYTGWYESYSPTTGDDFKQIERDCPNFDGYIDAYRNRIMNLVAENKKEQIGKGEVIKIEQLKEPKEEFNSATKLLANKFKM